MANYRIWWQETVEYAVDIEAGSEAEARALFEDGAFENEETTWATMEGITGIAEVTAATEAWRQLVSRVRQRGVRGGA